MDEVLRKMVVAAPNSVCICIDRREEDNHQGRIFTRCDRQAIPFYSVNTLVREMEKLFDRINFPQASTRQRSFFHRISEKKPQKEVLEMQDIDELLEHSGDLGTFIINVKYRQNATWQGEVIWAEKKERKYFRSALELLKLIDGALDECK